MVLKARPYQEVAVQATIQKYEAGRRALLLHLPTGAGKTVIATLVLEAMQVRMGGRKTLFLAHRREILDQTARTIAGHLPDLKLSVEQGERRADRDADVVVASVQSLIKRKSAYKASDYGLIIADECHRALAPSWADVLQYFRDRQGKDALLLGMTATPRRSDGRSAMTLFEEVAYEIDRVQLQELGYLTPMRYFAVQADLRLGKVKQSGGDFQTGALSRVMNTPPIRQLTVDAWRQRGKGRKTIAFCAGVEHARQLAADLAAAGARTAMVSGKTVDRDQILKQFRDGELDVVTNYGVLTEGYDEPSIGCVLMARPTTSPLVYTQCVGRGLRPCVEVDKRDCAVVDIVDRATHQLQYGAPHLAGLPSGWKTHGRDPFREQRAVSGIRVTDPEAYMRIQSAEDLEQVHAILMELPPETVLAGLDGLEPLCYQPARARPKNQYAKAAIRDLSEQAGAVWKRVVVEDYAVELHLSAGQTLDSVEHLRWHLERVTGRTVTFCCLQHTGRSAKTLLCSMLRVGLTLEMMELDERRRVARATVAGLRPAEGAWLRQTFQHETGLDLDLNGQLALDF
jgi:ATP-dependent helicase IRC3